VFFTVRFVTVTPVTHKPSLAPASLPGLLSYWPLLVAREAQAIFFRRRHQLTSITNDPSDHSTTLLMGPPPHKLGQYEGRRLPSLRSNDVTLPPRCIGGRTSRPCHAAAALPYVPKS
jgi:hypothetical protein